MGLKVSPRMPPRAVLLDIMGTVVTEPYPERQIEHFGLPLERLRELKDPQAWIRFELGELSEEQYYQLFFKDRRAIDGDALQRAMVAGFDWVEGMEALISHLARWRPLYALSNYPTWYRLIERRLGLSRFLEWRFVSCDTGVRKPDPRAYLGAAAALGLDPGDCLFIDDREINCAAARDTGMAALHFQRAGRLVEDFAARGWDVTVG